MFIFDDVPCKISKNLYCICFGKNINYIEVFNLVKCIKFIKNILNMRIKLGKYASFATPCTKVPRRLCAFLYHTPLITMCHKHFQPYARACAHTHAHVRRNPYRLRLQDPSYVWMYMRRAQLHPLHYILVVFMFANSE